MTLVETAPSVYTGTFSILAHRNSRLVTVCHCPNCCAIYHSGKYTLQGAGMIVCHQETFTCAECAEGGLPFPMMFNNVEEVTKFYLSLKDGKAINAALALKESVELAHADPEFFQLGRKH